MLAVEDSDAKMTEALVDLGASVDVMDAEGPTLTPTLSLTRNPPTARSQTH